MLKRIPLCSAFTLLESGPVVMLSVHDGRKNNLMTLSWHMILDFSPRIAICTGAWNYSFSMLMKTKECVICIPAADLLEKMVRVGMVSGRNTDKFEKFGLTGLPADTVQPLLVKECIGCIECRVTDYIEKHNIIILEGTVAWLDDSRTERRVCHAVGNGKFIVDGEMIDCRSLMESKIPEGV